MAARRIASTGAIIRMSKKVYSTLLGKQREQVRFALMEYVCGGKRI
jgi:hypothetical protein